MSFPITSISSPNGLIAAPTTGNAVNLSNLSVAMQNLANGSSLMPTLNVVQAFVQKYFGVGPYSLYPIHLLDLAGTWNIVSGSYGTSTQYLAVSPFQTNINVQTATPQNVSINSYTAVTDLVVSDLNAPVVHGFLSLQPGNYVIYTPFPSSSVTNPAYLPVAGVGLMTDLNTLSMVMFPSATSSYWRRVSPFSPLNVGISNALVMSGGNVPVRFATGSPAGIANAMNLTPQTIQNAQNTALSATTSLTLPMSSAFNQTPFNANPTNVPSFSNAGPLGPINVGGTTSFSSGARRTPKSPRRPSQKELKEPRVYTPHSTCSCPSCHAFRTTTPQK
ncbi:MAG: hypothetical protein Sylvanvirus12_5 [Sylvanvirus sp.]|uniref:Uncharacterized protein n=1 Tax=Sylvanvirus sp. TaxID=2487774 RepID=A0A3G5AKN0_9VIRU|nr:MAG: hypothetical protein Sylvanvirus12_5 [Sylvanvirus sp.]